ncbi:MAG: hypothetical protein HUK22_04255, partial [Thermoguttaceae bacterium]|nr:hypothetical protein [Thermoguttaceae bacterium]
LTRLTRFAAEAEARLDVETAELEAELAAESRRRAMLESALRSLNAAPLESPTLPGGVVLSRTPLQRAPDDVVRRYFRELWRRQNWPLGAMGDAEWRRLADAVRGDARTSLGQFPGNIFVVFPDDATVKLERRAPILDDNK